MYWADEMVPKRANGQAANRRLTRSIHNVGFIISFIIIHVYLSTHTVHVHAGAIRKLMCGLFACTSNNPLS